MDCTLIKKIGKGAYGEVWKGKCDGDIVAVKIMSDPDYDKMSSDWSKEVNILQKLIPNCQPYALCFKGAYVKDKKGYILTNYIKGPDLLQLIARMSLEERQEEPALLLNMIEGIHQIHEAGVLHLDIKEQNIMHQVNFKYIDFGYGCTEDVENIDECINLGTFYTAAPEIIRPASWEQGESLDIWSVGIVLLRWYSMPWEDKDYNEKQLKQYNEITGNDEKIVFAYPRFPPYSKTSDSFLDHLIKQIPNFGIRAVVGILLVKDWQQRNVNFVFALKLIENAVNIHEKTHIDIIEIIDKMINKFESSKDVDEILPTIQRIIDLH